MIGICKISLCAVRKAWDSLIGFVFGCFEMGMEIAEDGGRMLGGFIYA
jgi:hypothetical protein